ncbi:MAG: hypothetical protein LQ344_005981 [Seirophora lacunosa]|nr:MAG: hypothetical protein LQ344_005981 [Seirophora lacunosa]
MTEAAAKLRYRALPLIASPLKHDGEKERPGIPKQTYGRCSYVEGLDPVDSVREHDADTAAFREREEASSLELFFDLFFVANLTTLESYIGFFAILWFTWLEVVLFDVRFGTDSLFERIAKLIHCGVMITFAIVGPRFDPSKQGGEHVPMKQLNLVLVVSRVVLIAQYASVMLHVRGKKKIITPLAIHIVAFAIGAVLCVAFFLTFTRDTMGQAHIIWYVIIVLEALTVFVVAGHWRAVSFQHTHLNERCGLLTLIILGEGIIMLTISTNYMVQGENFSKGMIAQIISAVLITYFVYMLYFDQTARAPRNPHLHHAWALAHFPFHTALVLLLEGTSRLITWRNALEIAYQIFERYATILADNSSSTSVLAQQISNFSTGVMDQVHADPVKYNVTGYLTALQQAGDANGDEAKAAVYDIFIVLVNATLKFFKIDADPNRPRVHARWITTRSSDDGSDPFADLGAALQVYDLVFVYFFIAAGLTLVLTAVLMVLNRPGLRHCKGDWATVGLRVVVGVGLALVAVMNKNDTSKERFLYSPWMVPTVMLGIGLVVVLDGVLGWAMGPVTEEEGKEREEEKGRAQQA